MYRILILSVSLLASAVFAEEQTDTTQPTVRVGAGDSKVGYETKDYKTDSLSIAARQGVPTDLLKVIKTPPLGLPPVPVPANNPITDEKVQLGKKLFFDRRLSINDTFSCAMCHIPEQGFTNHEIEKAVGVEGRSGRRNAPTIYNVAYMERLFHDGREIHLEDQAWAPLLARNEMAMTSIGHVIEKVRGIKEYKGLFEEAFDGKPANVLTIGQALASYQRTLTSGNSSFDRWYYGKDEKAISSQAKRGFKLFMGKAHCVGCHSVNEEYALFTDNQLHNTGIGYDDSMGTGLIAKEVLIAPGTYATVKKRHLDLVGFKPIGDLGYYEVTQDPDDRWKYRTPSLRNIALTGPYMHNGALHTLHDVIEFYRVGGIPNVTQSPLMRPLDLTDEDVDDLVAFMETLTGDNVADLISDAFSTPVGDTIN